MKEFDGTIITPRMRWAIVKRLLRPEIWAEGKTRIAVEIRFLKMLEKLGYADGNFWMSFNLGFQLRSLAWLKNDGRTALNQAWGMYLLDKQQKKTLDQAKKEEIMAKMKAIENLGKAGSITVPKAEVPTPKKQSILDWVDS